MEQQHIQKYHPLGNRTLFMLIFRRSAVLFLLLPLFLIGLIGIFYIPVEFINLASTLLFGFFFFIVLVGIFAFFIGLLEYFRFWIFVDDKDLKIARGLISTEQIGIPYRRIQDIRIQRSLLDQIFGVSDIVIMVMGSEDDDQDTAHESTTVLPALDSRIAIQIQDIVLKKAQVEQIHIVESHKSFQQ